MPLFAGFIPPLPPAPQLHPACVPRDSHLAPHLVTIAVPGICVRQAAAWPVLGPKDRKADAGLCPLRTLDTSGRPRPSIFCLRCCSIHPAGHLLAFGSSDAAPLPQLAAI